MRISYGFFFKTMLLSGTAVLYGCAALAQSTGQMVKSPTEKARVFITDSQSWEVGGGGGGTADAFGSAASGGARPQTAEIVKTFGERCPDVAINNIKGKANYIVLLDHEGGKSFVAHRNKVAVFTRITGDSLVSKSTYSLGASVQEACNAIRADWAKNSDALRAAENEEGPVRPRPALLPLGPAGTVGRSALLGGTRVLVVSAPDGADIAVDGSFVGNTPSTVNVPEGDHTVTVSKNGYRTWERKIRSMGGSVRLNAELEAQQDAAK
jgi:hypothetical protein